MDYPSFVISKLLSAAIIFLLWILLPACSGNPETNLAVYRALDESLVNSNNALSVSSESIYNSMEQKLTDSTTSRKARVVYPKVLLIKEFSTRLVTHIEGLKTELKREGLHDDNRNAVMHFFRTQENGNDLLKRLRKYKEELFAMDARLDSEFRSTIILISSAFDTININQQDITKTYFNDIPTAAALAMLSKLQNNVKIIENRMMLYYFYKSSAAPNHFYYSTIVGQSSTYVRGGEKIEISAGVGYLSSPEPEREIIINGKKIPTNETGLAIYNFKVPYKAGKYFVPVKISFIDQDGKKQTIEKRVEYTVANEIVQEE